MQFPCLHINPKLTQIVNLLEPVSLQIHRHTGDRPERLPDPRLPEWKSPGQAPGPQDSRDPPLRALSSQLRKVYTNSQRELGRQSERPAKLRSRCGRSARPGGRTSLGAGEAPAWSAGLRRAHDAVPALRSGRAQPAPRGAGRGQGLRGP